jgi:hypothetical protein
VPRRLTTYRSTVPIWIAFVLALLLFAAAMALALWHLGPYDGSVARHQMDLITASIRV